MKRVALTGNVASGKSEVARVWQAAGVPVVSADDLARKAVEPGSPALEEVVEAFGRQVLNDEGGLDRDAVRRQVFSDDRARKRLESILHPWIRRERASWEERQREAGSPLAVSEIPLLFEVGLEDDFDTIVLVHAPESRRLSRMKENRGLDSDEARRIMDAQMDPESKRERADHVLINDGTLQELESKARNLLETLGWTGRTAYHHDAEYRGGGREGSEGGPDEPGESR